MENRAAGARLNLDFAEAAGEFKIAADVFVRGHESESPSIADDGLPQLPEAYIGVAEVVVQCPASHARTDKTFETLDRLAIRTDRLAAVLVLHCDGGVKVRQGDFEDAVYCWRTQSRAWPDRQMGVVLAAGAGAMGVRLGMPVAEPGGLEARPELGVGDPADVPFLDTAIGLLWRALVLWVAVLVGMALVAYSSRVWA